MSNITETTINNRPCLLVGVPEHTNRIRLRSAEYGASVSFYNKFTGYETLFVIPPGDWTTARLVSEVTEEEAAGMVEVPLAEHDDEIEKYYCYQSSQHEWLYCYYYVTESLHSFVRANGMEVEETVIIF